MDAAIELLRRIPASRLAPGGTYREGEIGYDLSWQAMIEPDAWHVPVTVIRRYASMEDIKAYAVTKAPDLAGGNWSMTRPWGGGARLSWGEGRFLEISLAELEALETDHADDYMATDQYRSWCFSCGREEWPEAFGRGPVRIGRRELRLLLDASVAAAAASDAEGLIDALDCADLPSSGGRLLQACVAAYQLAGKTGTAAFVHSA